MTNDPRDSGAYRMAVAAVGFALIVALAGVCVIIAVNGAATTPHASVMVSHIMRAVWPAHPYAPASHVSATTPGPSATVPQQLWTTISALGGGLLGILAPSPAPSAATKGKPAPQDKRRFVRGVIKIGRGLVILGKDIWSNRAIVILLAVFGVSVAFGISDNSAPLQALAGASGGVLVGMLAPSPGKKDSPASDV
jgi:hypothetical protein